MPVPFVSHDAAAAPTCGIGWRHAHYAQLLAQLPALGFIEVHSENFFADGGAALATLEQARCHYAISLHGVGLALGSAGGIDDWHLERLARLVQRIDPVRVSDHACFARAALAAPDGLRQAPHAQPPAGQMVHGMDLLPIPFSHEALDVLCANVQRVQARLQRPMLVENLSAYVQLAPQDMPEAVFFNALSQRTGCQILLDVNNLFVNACNTGAPDRVAYCVDWLAQLHPRCVGEIHLAGHSVLQDIVIDDHSARVCPEVWAVYQAALARFGANTPSLVEWDTAVPELAVLLGEAQHADAIAQGVAHTANAIAQGIPAH